MFRYLVNQKEGSEAAKSLLWLSLPCAFETRRFTCTRVNVYCMSSARNSSRILIFRCFLSTNLRALLRSKKSSHDERAVVGGNDTHANEMRAVARIFLIFLYHWEWEDSRKIWRIILSSIPHTKPLLPSLQNYITHVWISLCVVRM